MDRRDVIGKVSALNKHGAKPKRMFYESVIDGFGSWGNVRHIPPASVAASGFGRITRAAKIGGWTLLAVGR